MAKTFDQYMAESGRQSELDKIRNQPGEYEKARDAYNQYGYYGSGMQQGNSGLAQEASRRLAQEIANQMIDLDAKLSSLQVHLSDAEKDAYLQKAIDQITPYYNEKQALIEQGISEGKIRDAEDLLIEMNQVKEDVTLQLEKYDINQAQTEEEFTNTLAALTAQKGEDLEVKKLEWRDRIDEAKQSQIQSGTLTSGVGRKDVKDLQYKQQLEQQGIERRAGEKQTALETEKKYSLESIALARKAAEQKRLRVLGTPDEEAATKADLYERTGLSEDQMISEAEIARRRLERGNIKAYDQEDLSDLEEQRKRAIESRKLELQEDELAIRKEQEAAKLAKEKAEKAKQLNSLGYQLQY